ncbi:hypothetical protein Hanom_Chr09g00782861 [Helianthus anomalus]
MTLIQTKGIDLKDTLAFAALGAKVQGTNVGVSVCEGVTTRLITEYLPTMHVHPTVIAHLETN